MEPRINESKQVIHWAVNEFERIALACSFGKDSVTVLSLVREVKPDITVFWINTGYSFQETLDFKDRLKTKWNLKLVEISPRITKEDLERACGKDLYKRDPKQCCERLKVEPTRRLLRELEAWITGLRRDETEHRKNVQVVERFEGMPVKINPIAKWTAEDVWQYIKTCKIPYNPLYDKGYPSLGCEPCTRACIRGRFERAGRWSGRGEKECGMHTISHM